MIGAVHIPGTSLLHRAAPGVKLAGLLVLGSLAFLLTEPGPAALFAAALALAHPLCGVGWRPPLGQARDLALLLLFVFAAQAWVEGWAPATATVLRILGLVWAAGLITLTTPFSAMMEALERGLAPLRPLGVAPARVAFALTLAVRFVPVLQDLLRQTREAQAARGLGRNPAALATPLVIRVLRLADRVAEALEARNLDSPDPREETRS